MDASMQQMDFVKQMKRGDICGFDIMYEKYKNQAMHMAYLITGNYADAEDILQEAFVKCYCNINELKENDKFQSWFFQLLTRTAWRYCKKRGKEQPVDEIFEMQKLCIGESALEQIIKNERTNVLMKAIGSLAVKQRTVIILYYYNQLSIPEIAKVMKCKEGTVKSRLYVARNQLREIYDLYDYEEEKFYAAGERI